jgi:hypothetical protein
MLIIILLIIIVTVTKDYSVYMIQEPPSDTNTIPIQIQTSIFYFYFSQHLFSITSWCSFLPFFSLVVACLRGVLPPDTLARLEATYPAKIKPARRLPRGPKPGLPGQLLKEQTDLATPT